MQLSDYYYFIFPQYLKDVYHSYSILLPVADFTKFHVAFILLLEFKILLLL